MHLLTGAPRCLSRSRSNDSPCEVYGTPLKHDAIDETKTRPCQQQQKVVKVVVVFYIMDKAYVDYGRLHRLHRNGAFFVTRAKQNARFSRRYSHPADKPAGIRFDQTVTLSGFVSHRHYPDPLRRIGYRDPVTGKDFVFVTNNFVQPALTVASLYKSRWQVELFFKWIKHISESKPSTAPPRMPSESRYGLPSPFMS